MKKEDKIEAQKEVIIEKKEKKDKSLEQPKAPAPVVTEIKEVKLPKPAAGEIREIEGTFDASSL